MFARPTKPVTPAPSAYDFPSAHSQAIVALTARYLPMCRSEIRAARAAGKQPCLPHQDEQHTFVWARMKAAAALRHGVREDLAPAMQVAA